MGGAPGDESKVPFVDNVPEDPFGTGYTESRPLRDIVTQASDGQGAPAAYCAWPGVRPRANYPLYPRQVAEDAHDGLQSLLEDGSIDPPALLSYIHQTRQRQATSPCACDASVAIASACERNSSPPTQAAAHAGSRAMVVQSPGPLGLHGRDGGGAVARDGHESRRGCDAQDGPRGQRPPLDLGPALRRRDRVGNAGPFRVSLRPGRGLRARSTDAVRQEPRECRPMGRPLGGALVAPAAHLVPFARP